MGKKKRVLIGLAIIISLLTGVYLYSQYNPEDYLLFPKCPVYTITGYQCPGCGSQRALHNFFQGNILMAFAHNPLIMFLVPYIMLGIYIEYISNKSASLTARLRNIFYGKWAQLTLAIVIVSYTILRNIYTIH